MLARFDRRVVPEPVLELVRSIQAKMPCQLGGGAALSGAYLAHRLSHDVDLFCESREGVRTLVDALPSIAAETGARLELVRDAGSFARAHCELGGQSLELDLVWESPPDLGSPAVLEGVRVRSLEDLRASKLTCLLSRSEPRDLVDVLFIERAGYRVEADLPLALQKDRGIDPGVLAWLMREFPTRPMPKMLEPLSEDELLKFRGQLRDRLRSLAVPEQQEE